MKLRPLLSALLVSAFAGAVAAPAQDKPPLKVLRYAFETAETTLDPAKVYDLYSRTITPHLFEGLYAYDHLARPVKVKPLTALELPTHSDDFRVWTIKLRPGIYFADDPAFKGKRRELVAEDYVYTLKRFADPLNKSPAWADLEEINYLGLGALRKEALEKKRPFDYDRPIEGARALDRYTLQFRIAEPRPRFIDNWANSDLFGAVAREVVEYYGDKIDEHPVGTGPFRLVQWRRSSLLAFERNPNYRERFYDAEPAADDAEGQALAARFKGRRLPMVDRVEVSIIEEQQPRWLSFLNDEYDFLERVGNEFLDLAMPGGKIAPHLAKRGIHALRQVEPGSTFLFFNMEDATVGGYTPEKVALRRAIGLGMDTAREIQLVWKKAAIFSQQPTLPYTSGYDPARAKALLDLYGYVDRDGDGWRDMPDGSPLALLMDTQSDQRSRTREELMQKNLKAIGLRMNLTTLQWPESLKRARAGSSMMWTLGSLASSPDGQDSLERFTASHIGGQNMARFKLAEFDAITSRMRVMPDGPERLALFEQAKRLAVAYMPYKFRVSRYFIDMSQPWFIGYRRPVFWTNWWEYVDIDDSLRTKKH